MDEILAGAPAYDKKAGKKETADKHKPIQLDDNEESKEIGIWITQADVELPPQLPFDDEAVKEVAKKGVEAAVTSIETNKMALEEPNPTPLGTELLTPCQKLSGGSRRKSLRTSAASGDPNYGFAEQ